MLPRYGFLIAVLACLGCRKVDQPPPKTVDERTKARLLEIIDLVQADRRADVARHLAYRGTEPARRWKSVCDYEADKPYVDRVCERITNALASGKPRFLDFSTERESEGEWLLWKVAFGKTGGVFACLEIDGEITLGDMDGFRRR